MTFGWRLAILSPFPEEGRGKPLGKARQGKTLDEGVSLSLCV